MNGIKSIMKIYLLSIILSLTNIKIHAIDTSCASSPLVCPANSACVSQYCQCNALYILDCATFANYLTSEYQDIVLTNATTYMQTQYEQPDVYYSFTFKVCCSGTTLTSYNMSLSLYANNGANTLSDGNFVGTVSYNLNQLVQAGECVDLVQYQIKLERQPNGQTQNLIVGLTIAPDSPANQVVNATATIRMNVQTKQIISSGLLMKMAIGIISVCSFVVICIIIFCCYRRWKAKQVEKENLTFRQRMVEDFKNLTPQVEAKALNIPAMTTCSICLGEFEPENKVRKIICRHLFHSECIDSWCIKNLSCPVCRLQLDPQSLKTKKKQIEMSDFRWNENSLSARQQLMSGN